MMFTIGIVLFALAILASVALHECGHMWVARATGMKVRRYFVGFGPTIFSWRRGETEYGLKALPLGGFIAIAAPPPVVVVAAPPAVAVAVAELRKGWTMRVEPAHRRERTQTDVPQHPRGGRGRR